jgi:hypothetical protein
MFRKDNEFLLHMWHPSCYSIKSFDQRRDRNQDQGNIPSSRHQRDQKDQRGLKNLKITHKRAGNKKGYRMVLNGNIKDIKGQGAIRASFGINMSKNENPSEQNDILVVVKVTLTCRAIYSLLYGVRFLTALKTVMRSLDVLF